MTVILLVDNTVDFLDTRAEFLENAGYQVVKAYTLADAQQQLADTHIHLAILDMRLVHDDDEKDVSGLTLAQDPAYGAIPKIILTGYPSYEAVREVLGPALDGLPPAVDFLSKKDGPEAMIQSVEKALGRFVRVNRELEIHWDARRQVSPIYLVSLLQPRLSNHLWAERADEMEDLFRRLFYDYTQIRIPALLWQDDGRICLSVLARSNRGAIDARIVVCGACESLDRELERVRELAPETLEGVRLDHTERTIHFAAVAYALPDADLETFRPLGALFQDATETLLKATFRHLLTKALPSWHWHGCDSADQDLMALYRSQAGLGAEGLSQPEVERRFDALVEIAGSWGAVQIKRHSHFLVLDLPNDPRLICPDPVAIAYGSLDQHGPPTLCRISPGRLTADNILVDGESRTWLTDFACAGQAPTWWDYICLEAMVRFDFCKGPDLQAWLEFEEHLTQSARLQDSLPAREVITQLKTPMVLIEQIRRQASSEAGSDLLPYEAGLLAWVVGAMARYELDGLYTQAERMRAAHLIVAAALLARKVAEPSQTSDPLPTTFGSLRLGDDGVQVWRGDQRIPTLGEQEMALFRYLLENAGQVVSRSTLMTEAFGKGYSLRDPQSSLNSLILHLRQKIEPDPAHPRYLFTSRGEGYRLEKDG